MIKDGTDENDTTLKDAERAAATPAAAPAATPATQEPEAAGLEDAAGESQPDPDAGFTLNETEEDSAQNQEGNNPTENPTEDTTDNHTEDTKDNPTEPPRRMWCTSTPRQTRIRSSRPRNSRPHHLCRPCGKDQGGHSGTTPLRGLPTTPTAPCG